MEYCKIGGRTYDAIITAIEETFNILYSENSGRTMSTGARMTLDPLGTFYGHRITFQRKQGKELEYDALFDFVSKPRYDGIPVELVHNQKTIKYDAYISQGTRRLKKIDETSGKVYWGELVLNIIPMEAQVAPE